MQELLECLKSMKNFKTSHLSVLDLVDERQLAAEQDMLDEEEERVQRFAGWLSEENRQGVACGFNTIITIAHVTSFCTRTPKVTRLFFGGKSLSLRPPAMSGFYYHLWIPAIRSGLSNSLNQEAILPELPC